MKSSLKKGTNRPAVDTVSTAGKTRDETARTVGIGSGRTYERQKAVIAQLKDEDDGDQLIQARACARIRW